MDYRDEVIRSYQEAIQLKPGDAELYLTFGDIQEYFDDLDEAVRAFEQAVRLDQRNSLYHDRLAHAYAEAGRNVEAIGEYKTIIRLNEGNPSSNSSTARYELGLLYLKIGDKNAAMDQYRALRQGGSNEYAERLLNEISKQP